MKLSFARKLRFSWIGKKLFKVKFIDYILRRLFLNKFIENYYEKTTTNWKLINDKLFQFLKEHKGFLGHGAALSLIRDNKINYNQDLDYDIYTLKNEQEAFKQLENLGFKIVQKTYLNGMLVMFIIELDKCYVDFFIINNNQDEFYICTACYEYNKNYFIQYNENEYLTNKAIIYKRKIPYIDIELKFIDNINVFLPVNYNDYFIAVYGYDWKKPKRYYNWVLEPKNNKVKIIKNNIKMFVNYEYLKNLFNYESNI